ncbi:MAG: ATP-dependent DNA helicase PcrA [Microgenomates group bacterium GW2011_GWC1_46_16]|uniref:DNA 3'-5' helicase n=2 Tax=Candidatus Collieribacteriota TaxID=1752725 RepID=A0A1F5FZU4_9BACT|nr:MAG: ATP-dependent DNA helicase PcrA [Microgenomates group bacterium GW2011_GWF1_46_12]KKU26948.1 MAG: ATP-dependent DNA helicase PcrA [Microgenomates group bacterium GW2011_GWC1_46_16]KKU27446.1 MAG: ATP-dependent DNA helicase PcrA [Microgenomates group bacterium GW2011_GWF2_46_18]KKU44014.1 MAG: ATP-dependent DNA helicase PcrA [Microgenomates group bacterium GW2011_GWA1_46_7]KKU60683.1 MAG: ATP-dependent DNA helicase PcrA [Microgenomates group bacterium GW2011_GWE1_47_12]OGD70441.1 MAG: h
MNNYLDELNEKQREAVEHTGTPLLILAGAGSGKTKTLTYKAAHLIHTGVIRPEELLMVTFTNKAAGEMRERVNRISGVNLPNVGTYHSIAARILRKDGKLIGIGRDFVIYDDTDQEDLVKQVMEELSLDPKRFKPRAIMAMIGSAKQEMIGPIGYTEIARGPFQEAASAVYGKYQKYLLEYSAVDFDDLLMLVIELLKKNPKLSEQYQDLFKYVFVDEYQDTNTAQYVLTKLLSAHRRLTVVGDASQSIYRFRGADYRNIQKLKMDFPDLTEIRLERNYRSTQNILDAATKVIGNNKSHAVLSLWTEAGAGEKITLLECYSGNDEAARVTKEILALKESGHDWREMALLYRTNAQSRAIEEAFIRNGIPYVLIGGTKFYERKEIKDLLAYLRILLNPQDKVSFARAEKAGKRKLAMVLAMAEKLDVKKTQPAEVLGMIVESAKFLEQFDPEIAEELSRIENVRELQAVAEEFADLPAFLENVALVQSEYYANEKKADRKNTVTLMTLHAAKGLEFPIVFMVGMEEGLFPHSRSLMEREDMEEERRLAYVGITRAKEKLYLSYAKQRNLWGNIGYQTKSRFIEEIPAELVEVMGGRATANGEEIGQKLSKSEKEFWVQHRAQFQTRKSGVRIDSLDDSTLDDFLSGNLSVEELLNR